MSEPEPFNYLRKYCALLDRTEVPPRFVLWCGLASILAALEARVWVEQGTYRIMPNFYIVLIAASGQKKDTAINLAAKLLRRASPGPNVISQKITPEALISALIEKQEETPSGKCGGIVIAGELATFLDKGAMDRGLGPMLTALWDCSPFEYQTKARGIECIENGYLSLLGGSTIELFRGSLPKESIGGGFTSRTMFVYEEATPPPVAWVDHDPLREGIEAELVAYLERLMTLEGPIAVSPEAKDYYIADYNARHRGDNLRTEPMLRNYENRRHVHLFKIAMALMLSESPRMVIEPHDLQGAKIILEEAEQYLPRVMELILASEVGVSSSIVYQYILSRKCVTRADLVRHFCSQLDAEEISKIINTLVISNRIKIDTDAGKLVYRLAEAGR